ncbi:hypothetical protein B0H16DRAFT_1499580 [Mycena metata]|uniref:MYND-type domain-containing protein n=1 Tax=Mycena metata TaxID=1033252 RepID=A0AAD7K6Z7_9AGAR|nr:hypothetical protein B0H16DRAFT_1499580 [Mycena metata]
MPSSDQNRGLVRFHDGAPAHDHKKCSKCLSHGPELSRCTGCYEEAYCSGACQSAHWPLHRSKCKAAKRMERRIIQVSGLQSLMRDFQLWLEYYDAPLQNCAIAAMRLTENPHKERDTILFIQIAYAPAHATLPVEHKFSVISVGRPDIEELPQPSQFQQETYGGYDQSQADARLKLGDQFYGVARIGVDLCIGTSVVTERLKTVVIDKTTARANLVRQEWWLLFREYVAAGRKMKFCCGEVPDMEGGCCCGGWAHEDEDVVGLD